MQSGTIFSSCFLPDFTHHLSPDEAETSSEYLRTKISLSVFGIGLTIIYLALLTFTGLKTPFLRIAYLSSGMYFRFLLLVFSVEIFFSILKFPLDYYGDFLLEHRYQLSNQKFLAWLLKKLKGALIGAILGVVVLLAFYFLLANFPGSWWILFASFFFLFQVIVAQLFPTIILPLFYKLKPITDLELVGELESLVKKFGYAMSGVFSFDLSRETKKANAALTGLGRSRKIIISDTLLDNFSHEEIEVVLAHELGHLVKHHMAKGIAVSGLSSAFGFFLLDRLYSGYVGSIHAAATDLSAVIFLGLALSVFGIIVMPLGNYYSRRIEMEADLFALKETGMVSQFTSSMRKLGKLNLTPEDPPAWIEKIFFSHPSIGNRIRTAESLR